MWEEEVSNILAARSELSLSLIENLGPQRFFFFMVITGKLHRHFVNDLTLIHLRIHPWNKENTCEIKKRHKKIVCVADDMHKT